MSHDDDMLELQRAVKGDPTDDRAMARLIVATLRFKPEVVGSVDVPAPFENYDDLTLRACPPLSFTPDPWSKDDVASILDTWEEDEAWTYHNAFWLVRLKNGRFAFVSHLEWGTCSYCDGSSEDVAVGKTLEDVILFGMSDAQRERYL